VNHPSGEMRYDAAKSPQDEEDNRCYPQHGQLPHPKVGPLVQPLTGRMSRGTSRAGTPPGDERRASTIVRVLGLGHPYSGRASTGNRQDPGDSLAHCRGKGLPHTRRGLTASVVTVS
jgi:hypothetical protein